VSLRDRIVETVTPDAGWIATQVKSAETSARKKWGSGWNLLSTEMKNGAIAREILSVIAGQAKSQWKDNEFAATLVGLAKKAP
jgi:hypothetical protein